MRNNPGRIVVFLKERRKKLKLSQSEVAKRMNVCTRSYQRMEVDMNLTWPELIKLSDILEFKTILIPLEHYE